MPPSSHRPAGLTAAASTTAFPGGGAGDRPPADRWPVNPNAAGGEGGGRRRQGCALQTSAPTALPFVPDPYDAHHICRRVTRLSYSALPHHVRGRHQPPTAGSTVSISEGSASTRSRSSPGSTA